jgi:glycosyltransferase involved in cell wall biosynthesis
MYRGKTVGIVIPCYKEETQIGPVLEAMPDFVDKMIVVDDKSPDKTSEVVQNHPEAKKGRAVLIRHEVNKGVGGAISTGYIWCRDNNMDIAVVMAGDGQMDPNDLPALLDPIVDNVADYSKGNRLFTGEAWQKIPKVRYFGNAVLTMMTKAASGYWHVTDSQTGYTALNKKALKVLPIHDIYPRYGMPNDFLVTLNIYNMRVMDIPINPLYGVGEKSKMIIHKTAFSLTCLMTKLFMKRMLKKYIIRDFHPLIFFYFVGFILGLIACPMTARIIWILAHGQSVTPINALGTGFVIIMSLQFMLFAMWFDMDYNRDLNPHH